MKKISKILLFMTLLVLLVGIVSATDVSDNTTSTASYVTEAVDDSQIVSQTDEIQQMKVQQKQLTRIMQKILTLKKKVH